MYTRWSVESAGGVPPPSGEDLVLGGSGRGVGDSPRGGPVDRGGSSSFGTTTTALSRRDIAALNANAAAIRQHHALAMHHYGLTIGGGSSLTGGVGPLGTPLGAGALLGPSPYVTSSPLGTAASTLGGRVSASTVAGRPMASRIFYGAPGAELALLRQHQVEGLPLGSSLFRGSEQLQHHLGASALLGRDSLSGESGRRLVEAERQALLAKKRLSEETASQQLQQQIIEIDDTDDDSDGDEPLCSMLVKKSKKKRRNLLSSSDPRIIKKKKRRLVGTELGVYPDDGNDHEDGGAGRRVGGGVDPPLESFKSRVNEVKHGSAAAAATANKNNNNPQQQPVVVIQNWSRDGLLHELMTHDQERANRLISLILEKTTGFTAATVPSGVVFPPKRFEMNLTMLTDLIGIIEKEIYEQVYKAIDDTFYKCSHYVQSSATVAPPPPLTTTKEATITATGAAPRTTRLDEADARYRSVPPSVSGIGRPHVSTKDFGTTLPLPTPPPPQQQQQQSQHLEIIEKQAAEIERLELQLRNLTEERNRTILDLQQDAQYAKDALLATTTKGKFVHARALRAYMRASVESLREIRRSIHNDNDTEEVEVEEERVEKAGEEEEEEEEPPPPESNE